MRKNLYTWTTAGEPFARAYIIGNYSATIAAFEALVEEALRDFPALDRDRIECSKITKSDRYKHHAVVHFLVPADTVHVSYPLGGESPDFYCP